MTLTTRIVGAALTLGLAAAAPSAQACACKTVHRHHVARAHRTVVVREIAPFRRVTHVRYVTRTVVVPEPIYERRVYVDEPYRYRRGWDGYDRAGYVRYGAPYRHHWDDWRWREHHRHWRGHDRYWR